MTTKQWVLESMRATARAVFDNPPLAALWVKAIRLVEAGPDEPTQPSYADLLAGLKMTAAELASLYESEGLHPTGELAATNALIARAGG